MPSISSVPPALIKETRDQVFKQIQLHPGKVDIIDVCKLRDGGNLIERSVLDYLDDHVMSDGVGPTSIKISHIVMESLKWRKEFGIYHIHDSDLPVEFYDSNLFEMTERPDGAVLIVMNVGNLKRMRQWSNIWIRFIVHEMEKLADSLFSDPDFFNKRKPHVLADASNIGIAHLDLNFIITIVPIFLKHFPQAFETIWLYGLPLFSRHMRGMVLRSLPARIAKKVMFTDKNTILDDMGVANVPVRYGGFCEHPLAHFNSTSASTLQNVGRKAGISESEIAKMISEMTPTL